MKDIFEFKGKRGKVNIPFLGVTFRVILSDKVVIAEIDRVKSQILRKYFYSKRGTKVVGKAFCHSSDTYDVSLGKVLAISRCYSKFIRVVDSAMTNYWNKEDKVRMTEKVFVSVKKCNFADFLKTSGAFSSSAASIFEKQVTKLKL